MSYTKEQIKYINYNGNDNTKLIACAGSGKTRCIIARISNLLNNKTYTSEEILMLTFSKFTKDDFIKKIKSYDGIGILDDSIKTIDSFAKLIIDPTGTVDVSLLSYRLMKYFEQETVENLNNNNILNKIKTVFIDEAQDLNEIQYNIFCYMGSKLNIIINMIGDPNQNIYQFRNSSDKYLTEFKGHIFTLTKNFRSHKAIVKFSKHLRPFNDYNVKCAKGYNDCEPSLLFYKDENTLETDIIEILNGAIKEGLELSDFAILAPTRGRMNGGGNSNGLCFISNILYKSKIKFKQFYEESVDGIGGECIKYEPKKDHVNVLTYMGSKGLEWKYVILIDADTCLINKRYFDKEKHENDRYLLYVACSRAIENMYIFSKCYFQNGCITFKTNQWFSNIPINLYNLDTRYAEHFTFSELKYCDYMEKETNLTKIIDNMDYKLLDELSIHLDCDNRKCIDNKKIFTKDYTTIEKVSLLFLGKYTNNMFKALYNIKMNRPQETYSEIESILGNNIISGLPNSTINWYYKNRNGMNWDKFNSDTTIPEYIKTSINHHFDKKQEFNSHIVVINGYYKWYILDKIEWIRTIYHKYLKCKNIKNLRKIIFFLTVIIHSINTQHYFHIKTKGKIFKHILTDFSEMFDEIEIYVNNLDINFISFSQNVNRWNIVSNIDIIDDTNNIWSLKCSDEISLKSTIKAILQTLMYNKELLNEDIITNESITINLKFLNLLKGEETYFTYQINGSMIKNIIS